MPKKTRVIVIGAGLGGLCLAQSLRKANIQMDIFERDSSPWDRPQGYRLHLEADALNAAREVLPPQLHAIFTATSMRTEPFTAILNTGLEVVKRLPTDDNQDGAIWPEVGIEPMHCNVDRATLRQILMTGLDDICHFGKRLLRYEVGRSGVTAFFDDGTSAQADVLVGADGIRSAVRAQRAPHADTIDTGVQAIYGRVPIETASKLVPPEALNDIFAIGSDRRQVFLGLGAVQFPTPPDQAAPQSSGMVLRPQDDYLVCIVGGRHENFPQSREELRSANARELHQIAAAMLAEWPARAATLVQAGDPSSFFFVDMYTSVPTNYDRPKCVTLLGDAVHAMTPTLGRGANVAMRDGALLARALRSHAEGTTTLAVALAEYEEQMLSYGFKVVRESVEVGKQRMGQNPLPHGSQ